MTSVFIDGESGTTGLRLRDRLSACEDVSLISLPHELRRDPSARADAMRRADVTVLLNFSAGVRSMSRRHPHCPHSGPHSGSFR